MALNQNDKLSIMNQILPEVEMNISSSGITVLANERLSMARFIPFDLPGRCRECKSTDVELDSVITKEGVTIFCSRIKGRRFVPFDRVYEMPRHCFFKIKNKGRVFTVEHGQSPQKCAPKPIIEKFVPQRAKVGKVPESKKTEKDVHQEFIEKLGVAVAPLEFAQTASAKVKASKLKAAGKSAHQEFMDKMNVAVAPLEFAQSAESKPKDQNAHQEFIEKLGVAVAPLEFAQSAPPKVQVTEPIKKELAEPKKETAHQEFIDKLGIAVAPLEFAQSANTKTQIPQPVKEEFKNAHQEFINKLGVAIAPLEFAQSAPNNEGKRTAEETLNEFFDSLNAATAGIPSQADTLRNLKRQSTEIQTEEENAIAALDQEMKGKKKKISKNSK